MEYAAYQLQYDSVHGQLEHEVTFEEDCLVVGDKKIKFFAERNPAGTCTFNWASTTTLRPRLASL